MNGRRRGLIRSEAMLSQRQEKRKVRRILLAIDGSEQSDAAVDEIARQHLSADSEVRVIAVVEPTFFPDLFSGGEVNMDIYLEIEKIARERARAVVEKAASKLRTGEGVRSPSVTTAVISGSPKRAIIEEAETFGADLIVVGSHGHGRVEGFLLGSVSQSVALHARCSVEIVRSPRKAEQEQQRRSLQESSGQT